MGKEEISLTRRGFLRGGAGMITALAAGSALRVQGAAVAAPPPLQTATTHPMKYYLSLPKGWSADRIWPVLVAPSAH
jgi:hypothetical protein